MPNFADVMNQVDARLDASRISDDLTLPDATVIRGRFLRGSLPVEGPDLGIDGAGAVVTQTLFNTAATAAVLALIEGATLTHAGTAYRLQRKYPPRGDHAGRITLELGA